MLHEGALIPGNHFTDKDNASVFFSAPVLLEFLFHTWHD